MRRLILGAALGAAMALGGCATFQQNLGGATPAQVTTLAEAEQASTLVEQAADDYVTNGHPTRAQLVQINDLRAAVHTALVDLETAHTAGQSLVFASINAALASFNSYEAANASPTATATAASAN